VPARILGIDNDTWSRYHNERNWFYQVVEPGFRYHLSNINAAIGLAQLDRYDAFRSRKRTIVGRYDRAFAGITGLGLVRHDLDEMFPFFYVVRVRDRRRDGLMRHLKQSGIASGVHYIPNHIQPLFAEFASSLPVTEQIFEEILTLPLYVEMTDDDIGRVVDAVRGFFTVASPTR
jgi:dTDP-4-amino-4,6-dideoxygalactose transaminase